MKYYNMDGLEVDEMSFNTGKGMGYDVEERDGDLYLVKSKAQIIAEMKKNLSDTDYMTMKYVEGRLPESDWNIIKEQRQQWRDRINELEDTLSND